MKVIKFTSLAKKDLKNIATYTQERWGKEQRNSYLKQIDKTFKLLVGKPSVGKKCDEIIEGYRKFPHGSHVIYYKEKSNHILIVRILHKSMDVTITTWSA